jgi:signal transduction histidine kinase/FixJ family two-component response regulator/HPt (histidine-containing phosphotransfer) domain-containing protein
MAFVVIAGVLFLLAFTSWRVLGDAELAVAQVKHTNEVLSQISTIREVTATIESLERGFIISGNKEDLTQQALLVQARIAAIENLLSLTADSPAHQTRLVNLLVLIQERRNLAEIATSARESQGFEVARAISLRAQAKEKETKDRFLSILTQMKAEELRLLKRRSEANQAASSKTIDIFKLTLFAMLGLLILVFVLFQRQIKTKDEQLALEMENHVLAVEKTGAEQTSRSKEEFLATLSHEIRTQMSSLLGLLELLAHSPLNRYQSEVLELARDSVRTMVRIIDDILDHAKIQAGKLEIVLEPVSIGHLLTRVNNNYASLANSKGLDLWCTADPRISPSLMADSRRLMQVLGNLISNAIKFTPEGFVEVRADFVACEAGVETIRFSLKDTGIGMAPEMQASLFHPFEPAGVDTARLYGGTGLGLAISRHLTQMMGSELHVQSAPGSGTIISATFKLALSDAVPAGQMRSLPRNATTSALQMAKLSFMDDTVEGTVSADAPWVLAVDDNQTNRILIERQLSLLGLRVRTVTDGDQALALWQSGDYALVLTDINMSGLNGYELVRAIRTHEAAHGRPRMPVLGWTANAMPDTLARCKAAGMDDVLHKPSDLARLRELLAHWLPSPEEADHAASTTVPVDSACEAPALDAALLQESFGNDGDKLRQLLPKIQKTLNEQIAAMNVALATGDLTKLKALSHNMSGSAGLMGAKALLDVCVRIEAWANSGEASAFSEELVRQFRVQAQRTVQALDGLA